MKGVKHRPIIIGAVGARPCMVMLIHGYIYIYVAIYAVFQFVHIFRFIELFSPWAYG